ncbi:MAG: peptide chain release factor-like protein [Proteobacteria bacterium]|nr:peptide chain release factor-like protein [Desulfobacula sp.]MBU3953705.1 peptide chain release factor-like protein [Pseudomonadota bacterium]MBU4131960.1 peptide chain release factor-like protein [Pseudomonadota bacterium]
MGPDIKKIEALEKKMADLGIKKEDIREKFIKSSGRGGQKVNKTASAVFVSHEKTGLCVKVGKHRSQHLNRFLALRSLVEKIEARMTGRNDKETNQMEKIRKQKQRRKKRSQAKLKDPDSPPGVIL